MVQCKAKSKQSGERCKRHAHPGFEVCVIHGGKSLVGPANPAYKHGKYSTLVPPRMLEHYNQSVHDPDLLAMRDQINLIDARIADVMKRTDKGESSKLWEKLQATWTEFMEARAQQDNQQMAYKLNQLGSLISQGLADYAAWDDVTNLVERRRKLAESEQKRLVQLKLVLTYDEAVVYAQRLLAVVQKHVSDPAERARIASDLRATVGTFRGLPGPTTREG